MRMKLVWLFGMVVLAFVGLGIRITVINASQGNQYSKQVLSQSQQKYDSRVIPFKRGDITDRNGVVLATSEKVYKVILDCKVVNTKEEYVELEDTKDDALQEESKVVIENCTKEDTDSNYSCLAVLPDVAKQYEKLYQGKKGKEYCENDISEEDSCEVVVTNDKTFWGYGLKKGEAAN